MVWEPLNLSERCPPNAGFTACSYFGHVYLSLLVELFAGSADVRKQRCLEHEKLEENYGDFRRIEDSFKKYEGNEEVSFKGYEDNEDEVNYKRYKDNEEEVSFKRYEDNEDEVSFERYGENKIDEKFKRHEDNEEVSFKRYQDNAEEVYFKKYEDTEEYDFIVAGGGAAGCVVASRLSEHEQFKVLLLEAGSEQPDVTLVPALTANLIGSSVMWMYRTHPNGKSCLGHPDQRCVWPLGKTLGGGSSVNSMAYVRGNKLDYDAWAAMGNDGWSYEDVLPYFKKSEKNLNIENLNRKYHGVDGKLTISRYPYIDRPAIMLTEAFNQSGLPILDFNGKEQLGTIQAQAFSQGGQRMSANRAFIQPKRYKRKNLTVRVESFVTEVLLNKNKAYGVRYTRNGRTHRATARREVILSAGPIRTPQILINSGIGPRDHLDELGVKMVKNLPVGYNLHDHVTFDGILIVLPNRTATTVSKKQILNSLYEYKKMEYKDGPLSGNGPVNSIAFMKTDHRLPAPDIQYQEDVVESWQQYIQDPSLYKSISIFPSCYYNGILPRTMLLTPKSRGRLYVNCSDVYGHPIIDVNYFGDNRDMAPIIKGVKFLLELENTEAFKERGAYFYKQPLPGCERYCWGSDEYIECLARTYTSTTYHPVGTCKMGPKWDKTAVVDPRLRVYGVKGLRVIDSSIMPVVPRGNTNAPSIMVGERGVAFVLDDWLPRSQCKFLDE